MSDSPSIKRRARGRLRSSSRPAAVFLCAIGLLQSSVAQAEGPIGIDGLGRATFAGGWRLVPNGDLFARAERDGRTVTRHTDGGLQASLEFGWGATAWVEGVIDVFAGTDNFSVSGTPATTAVSYGAMVGVRVHGMGLWWKDFDPYVGASVGPTLVTFLRAGSSTAESINTGIAAHAGVNWRLNERFGVGVSYRWLFAQGTLPDLGAANGGGHWVSASVTLYFPSGGSTPADALRSGASIL